MLQNLSIKNVATIRSLEVNFTEGFNVLLGETGAGKSIIFDSLSFVLGGKADKTLIRTGEEFMRVDALFSDIGPLARETLVTLGYDNECEILISRIFHLDGKNTCKINGAASSPAILKTLAGTLVDVYGQHEGQALQSSKNHLGMLDTYKKESLIILRKRVAQKFLEYREITNRLASFGGGKEEKERQIDLLAYQAADIENAKLREGELSELTEALLKSANVEKILSSVSLVRNLLSEGERNVSGMLSAALSELSGVAFAGLEEFSERIKAALIEVEDIDASLSDFTDGITFDEKTINEMDSRADEIKRVIRKYGGSEGSAIEFLSSANLRLDELRSSDELVTKLEAALAAKKSEYLLEAYKLSAARKKNAVEIEGQMLTLLSELGMKNARFKILFQDMSEFFSINGIDNVEFYFSANLGEDMKSLSKTISGGEMSRFMLAFKSILADRDGISTLVFDEIDSGISGDIGQRVAEKIASLSDIYQVLCITHLSQVAAAARSFTYVSKKVVDGKTESEVRNLFGQEILEQIAKLSGGDGTSEKALAHAEELRTKMLAIKKIRRVSENF